MEDGSESFGKYSLAERLIRLESAVGYLKDNKKDVDDALESLRKTFQEYVRLERYKVVEISVFSVIGLMTSAVILALIALVVKGSAS
jgi:hypothetical protein